MHDAADAMPRMRPSAAYAARGTAFQLIFFALLCGALFNESRVSARHSDTTQSVEACHPRAVHHFNMSLRWLRVAGQFDQVALR